MFAKSVLDNGIRVVSQEMTDHRSVSLGIWVENGSRHELPDENGISHFIEHLLFKGTTTRTAAQIAELQQRIEAAERPVVILGGSRWSDAAVQQFASYPDKSRELGGLTVDWEPGHHATDYSIDFSPDGERIAFAKRSDGAGIWTMKADGSDHQQLTSNSAGDLLPDWSPDGQRIAFVNGGTDLNGYSGVLVRNNDFQRMTSGRAILHRHNVDLSLEKWEGNRYFAEDDDVKFQNGQVQQSYGDWRRFIDPSSAFTGPNSGLTRNSPQLSPTWPRKDS